MSLLKNFTSKICFVVCIYIVLVSGSKETKATNSSDVKITSPDTTLAGQESGLVQSSVKLEAQETYPVLKSEGYPINSRKYIPQSSIYKQDSSKGRENDYKNSEAHQGGHYDSGSIHGSYHPGQSSTYPSQDDYVESFEHYKKSFLDQQPLSHNPTGKRASYPSEANYGHSQDEQYKEDYAKGVSYSGKSNVETDYGHSQDGVEDYGNVLPYGAKIPLKANDKTYPTYSHEIGQKHVSYDFPDSKYPSSKSSYSSDGKLGHMTDDKSSYSYQVTKETPPKSYDTNSFYDHSNQGNRELYGKEQFYNVENGESSYAHEEPQRQQYPSYDAVDIKSSNGESGYSSQEYKGTPQKEAIVTSYYHRGPKAYSVASQKSSIPGYSSSAEKNNDYFPVIPKESGYVTNEPKQTSYLQDAGQSPKTESGYYSGGLTHTDILPVHKEHLPGISDNGKVSILIKQLGHSKAGEGYGHEGGERHGFLLLPVLPGKEGDGVRILKTDAYGDSGNKAGKQYQQFDYTYSPVQGNEQKTSNYKGSSGIPNQDLRSAYHYDDTYAPPAPVATYPEKSHYSQSYDEVEPSNGKSGYESQYEVSKGKTYSSEVSPYQSNSYKKPYSPSSSYEVSGNSKFTPLIPKTSQSIDPSSFISKNYHAVPANKNQDDHTNLGNANYEYSTSQGQYPSKGQGFKPSTFFPLKTVAVPEQRAIDVDFSSYGKNQKISADDQGYTDIYSNIQRASGFQRPTLSAISQKRIKSYAVILQRPQEHVQEGGYKLSTYPAASVRKSKTVSRSYSTAQFKPVLKKSTKSNTGIAPLYSSVKTFSAPTMYSPVDYSAYSKKY